MDTYHTEMSIEGKSFPLLKCEYRFSQPINEIGKPIARPKSGLLEVYCLGTDDEILVDWATNPQKKLNGKITFYRPGQSAHFKELSFEEAYCTSTPSGSEPKIPKIRVEWLMLFTWALPWPASRWAA